MSHSAHAAVRTISMCCLWYLLSSFTSQMTKYILTKMPLPFLLTQIQFIVSGCLAFSFIQLSYHFPQIGTNFPPGTVPTDPHAPLLRKNVFLKILPLGLLQSSGKYFSLSATQKVPVATIASLKALSPLLVVAGYRLLYRVHLPIWTYLSLVPLLGGVLMIIYADTLDHESAGSQLLQVTMEADHLKGLILCVISVVLMAAQQIYGKELITWNQADAANPISLVLDYSSPIPPSTPDPTYGQRLEVPSTGAHGNSTNSSLFSISPKALAKSFTRRPPNVRLPYSVSDLSLNELDPHSKTNPYSLKVEEARSSINPLAGLSTNHGAVVKPDKLSVILYISLIGFCISSVGFLTKEAYGTYQSVSDRSTFEGVAGAETRPMMLSLWIIAVSVCHFGQTLISYFLLGSIPALSYSIASMMKRIVIIVVSILCSASAFGAPQDKWFGRISTCQLLGLLSIGLGLYSYDRWGSKATRGHK